MVPAQMVKKVASKANERSVTAPQQAPRLLATSFVTEGLNQLLCKGQKNGGGKKKTPSPPSNFVGGDLNVVIE